MPDGSIVMVLCRMASGACTLQAAPQRAPKRRYRVSVTVDAVKEHLDVTPFEMDLRKRPGFEVKDMPAYSIVVFRFEVNREKGR